MAETLQNSREAEIAQGLRHPTGELTFPLDVLDYAQGHADFSNGVPPPQMSSASYDLGRNRAREVAEQDADFRNWMAAEDARRDAAMCEVLKDHPEALAEYQAKIAEIRAR